MFIQAIFILFIIFALSRVVLRFQKREITSRECVLWVMFWTSAAVVVLWPNILSRIAERVRIGRGVDVAIYVSILLIFYLLFRLVARMDRIEREITQLVRMKALDVSSEEYARSQKRVARS